MVSILNSEPCIVQICLSISWLMVCGLQVSEFEPLADITIEYRAHLVAKLLLVGAQCRERWNRLDPLLAASPVCT